MSQTLHLIDLLKKALKNHGKTYADVAKELGLSEASIKRLFSEKKISLDRFEQICKSMDMQLTDLLQMLNEERGRLTSLTVEQESEIASDLNLLLVTVCVLNRWSLDDITQHYLISTTECIRYLAKLDKLNIIELLPNNRIKLRVAPNFDWLPSGPIQDFFQANIQKEFFSSRFSGDSENLLVVNGMLSTQSVAMLQKKMKRLIDDFNELNNEDAGLPIGEREGLTMVLAMRHWQFSLFDQLRRPV